MVLRSHAGGLQGRSHGVAGYVWLAGLVFHFLTFYHIHNIQTSLLLLLLLLLVRVVKARVCLKHLVT